MILEIRAGGATRRVELVGSGTGWTVTIDGRSFHASLAAAGGRWSLLCGDAAVFRSHDIAFARSPAGELVVYVEGQAVPVTVSDPRVRAKQRRQMGGGDADGPRQVTTPMPGRIVKLLVAPGDSVTARQGVIVVEAMKMENELRAPKAGTVIAVHVQEGATVEAGAALMTIE